MKKLIVNLQYLTTPGLVLLNTYAVAKGGDWVWLGVLLLAASILTDTLVTVKTTGTGKDKNGKPLGVPAFLFTILYAMYPIFLLQQAVLAWRLYAHATGLADPTVTVLGLPIGGATTGWELVGATLSVGIWQGMGIVFGHELSHTHGWTFVLSRWIMALSGSAHFSIAHVYSHHIDLGDASDPATAPRGRSLYAHFILSHVGQSAFVRNLERKRLAETGSGFLGLKDRWIRGYLMSVPTLALFVWIGGWTGLAVILAVWVISNFELEVLNYLEHYGLIREADKPVEPRHSWDNTTLLTSAAFIQIGLQGDHHVRGETRFWHLEPVGAPNYGWGYYTLLAIAVIPPWWHAFMKKKLAIWDRDFATPGERAIAEEQNHKANYLYPAEALGAQSL